MVFYLNNTCLFVDHKPRSRHLQTCLTWSNPRYNTFSNSACRIAGITLLVWFVNKQELLELCTLPVPQYRCPPPRKKLLQVFKNREIEKFLPQSLPLPNNLTKKISYTGAKGACANARNKLRRVVAAKSHITQSLIFTDKIHVRKRARSRGN